MERIPDRDHRSSPINDEHVQGIDTGHSVLLESKLRELLPSLLQDSSLTVEELVRLISPYLDRHPYLVSNIETLRHVKDIAESITATPDWIWSSGAADAASNWVDAERDRLLRELLKEEEIRRPPGTR